MSSWIHSDPYSLSSRGEVYASSVNQIRKWLIWTYGRKDITSLWKNISSLGIYCPPPNPRNGSTIPQFFEEFNSYIDDNILSQGEEIICDDFNFHANDLKDIYKCFSIQSYFVLPWLTTTYYCTHSWHTQYPWSSHNQVQHWVHHQGYKSTQYTDF